MIQNVFIILLYTLVTDLFFFILIYIFGNRKQIIKLIKKDWLILLLIFGFTFWIISIICSFCGIKNDPEKNSLFSVETLYSCYVAIVIGAITVYFTVFAFTKPKKMAFVDYEKYVLSRLSKILYVTIGISLFINTLVIFFNYQNLCFRMALFDSIIYIIVLLVYSIFELNCLENEEKTTEIFVKSICSKIRQNNNIIKKSKNAKTKKKTQNNKKSKSLINIRNYAQNLFISYLIPCFKRTSFFVAFNKTDKIINKLFPELSAEEYKQYLYEFSSSTIDIYSWYADTYLKSQIKPSIKISLIKIEMDEIIKTNLVKILKNYVFITPEDLDKTIATAASLYEIWFKLYKMLFQYDKDLKYSEILKGVEPLSFGILVFDKSKKKVTNNYIELYNNYLDNAYQLVIFVLHNYNYLIFRSFLQDYIDTIQFVKLTSQYKQILKFRDYRLIVIGTYIANLIQEDRIDNKYKLFITQLLKEVETIQITYDSFIYTEPLSLTGVHLVEKDFHYYFLLMIIYALSSEKKEQWDSSLNEIISKIDLAKNEEHIYENLLDTLTEIPDIVNKLDLQCKEFICKKLKTKVAKLKKFEYSKLKKLVQKELDNNLSLYVMNDINSFYDFFNYCGKVSKENISKTFVPIRIPTGFSFYHSANYIVGKSSFDIFGVMDQFNLIERFLYHAYIVEAEKKFIKNLDELLEDISELNTITLLIPIELHSYFYTLKNIKYEGKSIIYNNNKITLKPDRNIKDFIIVQERLKNSIFVKDLDININTRVLVEDEEHNKIDVKIPIEPEFYIDINSKMTVYTLIGISDDPELNNGLIKITRNGD